MTPALHSARSRVTGSTSMHECVAAILRTGDTVLLCHRTKDREWFPNVWDLPGGHVQPGESAALALARELGEELGIEITPSIAPPFATIVDDALDLRLEIWLIDDWVGVPTNLAPDEHDSFTWFRPDELTTLDLADARYVDLLRDTLARPPSSRGT